MAELFEIEVRFDVDADDAVQAVELLFQDIEADEPVAMFSRIAHSGDEFQPVVGFEGPDSGEARSHSASVSYTFETDTAEDAAREFLDNLIVSRSWFVEVTDNASGAKFNVDAETGEVEELEAGSNPGLR